MTSMASWVAWRTGMSPTPARAVVAIAERVDKLPASIEAFRRGGLSLDQMATIARNAPAWADEQSRDYSTVTMSSGASPNPPTDPPPKPATPYSHPDGGRMDTGFIYFSPPGAYYDDLRRRCGSNAEYVAHIQPPGLR